MDKKKKKTKQNKQDDLDNLKREVEMVRQLCLPDQLQDQFIFKILFSYSQLFVISPDYMVTFLICNRNVATKAMSAEETQYMNIVIN